MTIAIKVANTTLRQLDWLVAKAAGHQCRVTGYGGTPGLQFAEAGCDGWREWCPSTNWAQGGPLGEQAKIAASPQMSDDGVWLAKKLGRWPEISFGYTRTGPTELIAKMRCYVAATLGEDVAVPKELCEKANPA